MAWRPTRASPWRVLGVTSNTGAGSALTNTARQVSGALGVAVLGSILAQTYRSQLSPHLGNLPASARNVMMLRPRTHWESSR